MKNINELIGIIKGINFDGIINSKEVVNLQSWVDKNRNLAYDKRSIELIKMVDSVLKDHIISEEEKQLMINTCKEFLKETNDNSSRIYELYGILEGIICDGEVNDAEVLRLKEWMDNYSEIIIDYKLGEEVSEIIEDILSGGVVTLEEQNKLLDMIKARLSTFQFDSKLSYLCKLVKEKKNIGIDLIDILYDESAMNKIHKRAEHSLSQAISSYSGYSSDQEIIVISLVLIAMLEYNGNYYDSVRSIYKNLYNKYSQQKVEGTIRSILNKFKKQSESCSRSRVINVALENAIVPQAFLSAFFEFIFDIYKLNFEYDLPNDPYEDFLFVFKGLHDNMLSKGDDISLNVTQKTYKLIVSTKQLIRYEEGLDALIKLSIIIVKLIDRRFWNKNVKIYNPYLKVGFLGWESTLKETSKVGRVRKKADSELRSRWEPKFIMYNDSIYLNPPMHKVKSQYDYRNIAVVVLNDGKELYRNNSCDIREIIGGYQVYPEKIELIKPLGKLTYRLEVGDEIIYDSKDKLYRKYIVFNNDGQEMNNNTDYDGTAFIAYKKGDAYIDNIISQDYYCLGYKLVRVGDAIEIGHDIFNFSLMAKPGIFGKIYANCSVQKENDDKLISVYHDKCSMVFEADNKSNKFQIDINGKTHKLSEMKYSETKKAGSTKYVVELGIEEPGVYEIEVNQIISGSKNRILQEKLVYDTRLEYRKEHIDKSKYIVHINSSLLTQSIDTEISIDNFALDFIKFEYEGSVYRYNIPFDFDFYKLSNGKWCSKEEDIWIDDIHDKSVLTLLNSKCDGMLVYTELGILTEEDIQLIDKGYYKQVPIYFLKSYRIMNKYVRLVFTAKGKELFTVYCYNKCVIDEEKTEILFDENTKKVTIIPVIHGKNKVYFDLFNNKGKKLYTSKLLNNGQSIILKNFKSFKKYTFKFLEVSNNLLANKNTVIFEINRIFYTKDALLGRAFRISEVYFEQQIQGKSIEKQWFFNKYFVKFNDVIDLNEWTYKGEVYSKSNYGDYYLSNINPVEVKICSDVIDGTIDIYITNEGDGLLFDLKHKGIMNSMEHPTAPDILSYTLDLKGEDKQ